eukprot:TRINITY_DN6912_c0_g1_i3.p1 TRINITY_DN6912_c0_g1~~TRINITY_DN6912_c0_g1_i3.p1  ORF type:complete len:1514 (-),score=661.17 TRINITY_DN6912_c0_g1_i3:304-4845(-)
MALLQAKPTEYAVPQVPALFKTHPRRSWSVLRRGDILASYDHVGTLLVGNYYDPNSLKEIINESPLLSLAQSYPTLASLHENGWVQVVHLVNGTLDTLDTGGLQAQAVLADDEFVVCISPYYFVLWQRSYLLSSPVVCAWQNPQAPRLQAVQASLCSLRSGQRIVLSDGASIQIWKFALSRSGRLDPSSQGSLCDLLFEARCPARISSLLESNGTIAAIADGRCYVWSIDTGSNWAVIDGAYGQPVCAISLDDAFLFVASGVSVALHQRLTAERLYELTRIDATTPNKPANRATAVLRVGRWAVVGTADGVVKLYDVNKEAFGEPIVQQRFAGAVESLTVGNGVLVVGLVLADGTGAGMLRLAVWRPPVQAFEPFTTSLEPLTVALSSLMILLQSVTATGEDVSELVATALRAETIVLNALSVTEPPYTLFADLLDGLEAYVALLSSLEQCNKLARTLASFRLRRRVERHDAMLHRRLDRLQDWLDADLQLTQELSLERPEFGAVPPKPQQALAGAIADPHARLFWQSHFGEHYVAEWRQLAQALRQAFQLTDADLSQLAGVLDHFKIGFVTQIKFSEFVNCFGPFSSLIWTFKAILAEGWFHGMLSIRESELLLAPQPEGAFLVRFLRPRLGAFALAFKHQGQINHSIVEPYALYYPQTLHGFYIDEADKTNPTIFGTLQELVREYNFCLKLPTPSLLSKQTWFYGDMTGEEATDHLAGAELGVFVIRFSSSGQYAVSFVDGTPDSGPASLAHVLITQHGGQFSVPGGEENAFGSVQELVKFYTAQGVFGEPLDRWERQQQVNEFAVEAQRSQALEAQVQQELTDRSARADAARKRDASLVAAKEQAERRRSQSPVGPAAGNLPLQRRDTGPVGSQRPPSLGLSPGSVARAVQSLDLNAQAQLASAAADQVRVRQQSMAAVPRRPSEPQAQSAAAVSASAGPIPQRPPLALASSVDLPPARPVSREFLHASMDSSIGPDGVGDDDEAEGDYVQDSWMVIAQLKESVTSNFRAVLDLKNAFDSCAVFEDAVRISKKIRDAGQHLENSFVAMNVPSQEVKDFIQSHQGLLPPKLETSPQLSAKLNKLRELAGQVVHKLIGSLYYLGSLLDSDFVTYDVDRMSGITSVLQGLTQIMYLTDMHGNPLSADAAARISLPTPPPAVGAGSDQDEGAAKHQRLLKKVIEEIIQTEREYVADLNVIVEVFFMPIMLKKIISQDDVKTIFSNVETFVNVNAQILQDWDARSPDADESHIIGDVFDKTSPYLKMYGTYCANHPTAVRRVNELNVANAEFAQTVKICETDPRCKHLSLMDYLIKPVQRLLKYPLLFRELLSHMPKSDVKTIELLNSTLEKIQKACTFVNEKQRESESVLKVYEIQDSIEGTKLDVNPARRFVKQGNANLRGDKGNFEPIHLILFNDVLLFTKQKLHGVGRSTSASYQVKIKINLEEARIVDVSDAGTMKNSVELSLPKKSYVLTTNLPQEKAAWLKELKALKKGLMKTKYASSRNLLAPATPK